MTKNIIKAGVVGHPISHSLSPIIHGFFLEKHKIIGSYEKIEVKPEELFEFIEKAKKENFSGFNITIPHKEEIFKKCDFLSNSASLTKAVNTVVITQDKKLFGHNSDVDGFIDNLKYHYPNFDFFNKTSFIIGAGGACRAIIYGLIKNGVKEIYITNRSELRAQNLISDFNEFSQKNNCQISFLNKRKFENNLTNCQLLINSSSLGMTNQEALNLDIKNLNKEALVYDIVYKPLMTELLIQAQKQNNKIITGIGMLVFQALIGFELWFKEKPNKELFKELLEILKTK